MIISFVFKCIHIFCHNWLWLHKLIIVTLKPNKVIILSSHCSLCGFFTTIICLFTLSCSLIPPCVFPSSQPSAFVFLFSQLAHCASVLPHTSIVMQDSFWGTVILDCNGALHTWMRAFQTHTRTRMHTHTARPPVDFGAVSASLRYLQRPAAVLRWKNKRASKVRPYFFRHTHTQSHVQSGWCHWLQWWYVWINEERS